MSQSSEIAAPVQIACASTGRFEDWLAETGGSLAVTTYQAGKVAMIGSLGQQLSLLMRQFDKPLGLAVEGNRLVLATRNDVILFANDPLLAHEYLEAQPGRYDALYLPRATFHTSDLHIHDVAFQGDDVLCVNTRFSCLAHLSPHYNFVPIWKPKFVSQIVPEDRCHLNGLAMVAGQPKYVTALGTTDSPGQWRENKAAGGVLIDIETDEILLGGLAMPHSPRWYDSRLWVLNSGAGELLVVDPASGQSTVVCGLPGYSRGLTFVGPYALVGMCRIREKHIFGGLPIQQRCKRLQCGVAVVDLRTGVQVGLFEFTAGCEELYDVQFLPGIRRPMILNVEKSAAREAITTRDFSYWLRASKELPGTRSESKIKSLSTSWSSAPSEQQGAAGGLLPDTGIQL